jgi:outer membrane protein OmpA-like peptidoglycan-associated protein
MTIIKKSILLVVVASTFWNSYGQQQDNRNLINLGPNINSKSIEINPHISADGKTLYFVREDHEQNSNFQDIWVSELDDKGQWKPAHKLEKPLNTAESNSVVSVSPDGNKLMIKGFYKKGKVHGAGYSIARQIKEGWSAPEGIVIDHYTTLDKGEFNNACISNDEKILIFSLCPEHQGKDNDLYISFRKEDRNYTKPVRIGGNMNTKGYMEFAPFLASDNKTLYFSSDRPGGLGATDIYMTERLDDTWLKWSDPINLGDKINGPGRDGYYTLDAKGTHAYMVSDKNSLGLADIVMVKLEEHHKPDPVVLVRGNIYDIKTNKPIDAFLEYHEYPVDTIHGEVHTDHESGTYSITFPYGDRYVVTAHAHGYVTSFDTLSLHHEGEYTEMMINYYLTPIVKGEKVVLKHVNFETNSAILQPESFVELDKVAKFLSENPEVKILIGGHTDNQGTPEKNLTLSDNRAKSVMNYLISKGINAERLQSKGFGQTQPMADNSSEENKHLNRRVEFTITEE